MPPTKKVVKFIKNNNYLNITYKTVIHVFFFPLQDGNVFNTDICYIYDNTNKDIYMFIYKKKFKKMSMSF